MMGSVRWYAILSATVLSLTLGIGLFWHSVEAPPTAETASDQVLVAGSLEVLPLVEAQTEPVASPTETPAPTAVPTATPTQAVAAPRPSTSPDLRVPILMYHRIDSLPPNADALRVSLSIVPTEFDRQVRFLKERGFTAVSLYEVYAALLGQQKLPPKPVVLTFDDGYADNYLNAVPVLKRYGFSGTFFILTDVAGTGEYMSWPQLREMAAAGMKIEVHGRAHLDLTRLSANGVTSQAKGARDAIQAQLGLTPMFYSYPSGKYNQDVIEIIKASGYLAAVTVNYGSDQYRSSPFELKRIRIDGRETFSTFIRKVGENP